MRAGPYTDSFKENIIRLHLTQKRTIQSLSKEYGVSTSTISRWVTVYKNTVRKHNEIPHTNKEYLTRRDVLKR